MNTYLACIILRNKVVTWFQDLSPVFCRGFYWSSCYPQDFQECFTYSWFGHLYHFQSFSKRAKAVLSSAWDHLQPVDTTNFQKHNAGRKNIYQTLTWGLSVYNILLQKQNAPELALNSFFFFSLFHFIFLAWSHLTYVSIKEHYYFGLFRAWEKGTRIILVVAATNVLPHLHCCLSCPAC